MLEPGFVGIEGLSVAGRELWGWVCIVTWEDVPLPVLRRGKLRQLEQQTGLVSCTWQESRDQEKGHLAE